MSVPEWNLDELRVALPPEQPWHVRANMVTSIDGAGWFNGRSGPLSGPADMHLFRLLRSVSDVVLVGAGTVRAERYGPLRLPQDLIAWRRARGLAPVPRLAVISGSLSLDPLSRLFAERAGDIPPLLLTTTSAPPERRHLLVPHAEVLALPDLSPTGIIEALAARDLRRIHLEGGPRTLGDFVAADALDNLRLALSPVMAGGGGSTGAGAGGRIVDGPPLIRPRHMRLDTVIQDGGFLFLSYVRSDHDTADSGVNRAPEQ